MTAPSAGRSARAQARRLGVRQRAARLLAAIVLGVSATVALHWGGGVATPAAMAVVGVGSVVAMWLWRDRGVGRWQAGARGEMATARVLGGLGPRWTVLHDLPVPLSRTAANIDHIVVGPNGVTVIDSKQWSGTVRVGRRRLRRDGADVFEVVERQHWCRDAVADLVDRVRAGVPVRAVVVVHGARMRGGLLRRRRRVDGVHVVAPQELLSVVRRGRRRLGRRSVVTVARALDRLGER